MAIQEDFMSQDTGTILVTLLITLAFILSILLGIAMLVRDVADHKPCPRLDRYQSDLI